MRDRARVATVSLPVDLVSQIRAWTGRQQNVAADYDDAQHTGDPYEVGKAEAKAEEVTQDAVWLLSEVAALLG